MPDIKTVLYPVKDLTAAKAVFGALLGTDPVADEPYYGGYQVGEMHIGLNPGGHAQGMTGPVAFCNAAGRPGPNGHQMIPSTACCKSSEKPSDSLCRLP